MAFRPKPHPSWKEAVRNFDRAHEANRRRTSDGATSARCPAVAGHHPHRAGQSRPNIPIGIHSTGSKDSKIPVKGSPKIQLDSLKVYYKKHAPHVDAAAVLRRFQGREQELLLKLEERYSEPFGVARLEDLDLKTQSVRAEESRIGAGVVEGVLVGEEEAQKCTAPDERTDGIAPVEQPDPGGKPQPQSAVVQLATVLKVISRCKPDSGTRLEELSLEVAVTCQQQGRHDHFALDDFEAAVALSTAIGLDRQAARSIFEGRADFSIISAERCVESCHAVDTVFGERSWARNTFRVVLHQSCPLVRYLFTFPGANLSASDEGRIHSSQSRKAVIKQPGGSRLPMQMLESVHRDYRIASVGLEESVRLEEAAEARFYSGEFEDPTDTRGGVTQNHNASSRVTLNASVAAFLANAAHTVLHLVNVSKSVIYHLVHTRLKGRDVFTTETIDKRLGHVILHVIKPTHQSQQCGLQHWLPTRHAHLSQFIFLRMPGLTNVSKRKTAENV